MTRCLVIACLVAALTGAAAPVPAAGLPDQPILLADPRPPGGEPPDPGTGGDPSDDPPGTEHPPAGDGSNAENNSGMTCC